MTVGGYQSLRRDVYRNEKALKYNASGSLPAPEEHAKL